MFLLCLMLQAAPDGIDDLVLRLDADAVEARDEAELRLRKSGQAARPALEKAAWGEAEAALRARAILLWLDYEGALPPVVLARLPQAREFLSNADPVTRRHTLLKTIPGLLGGNLPQGMLHAALADPDPVLRLEAAFHVAEDPDGRAGALALDFLRRPGVDRAPGGEVDNAVRSARDLLLRSGCAEARDVLPLLSASQPSVRAAAVDLLAALRHWGAAEGIRPRVKDCNEVAAAAIRFLDAAGTPCDPGVYLERAKWHDGAAQEALRQFIKLRGREAVPDLLALAREERFDHLSPLAETAELDLDAALPLARRELSLFLQERGQGPARTLEALEILVRRPGAAPFDSIFETVLRLIAKADWRISLSWEFGDFPEQFARCVPEDRLDAVLESWEERQEWLHLFRRHADLGSFAAAVVPHLDPGLVSDAAWRRAFDLELKIGKRAHAAALLYAGGFPLPPGRVKALEEEILDPATPPELLPGFFKALPWQKPGLHRPRLEALADRILNDPKHPLRAEASRILAWSPFVGRLHAALERDDAMALPHHDWNCNPRSFLPAGEGVGRVLAKRLTSLDPAMVLSVLQAQWNDGVARETIDFEPLLRSPHAEVRAAAISRFAHVPPEKYRPALRRLAREEQDLSVLAPCIEALHRLRDREGLGPLLRRELPSGSASDHARIRAVAELGTPGEILALEPRLKTPEFAVLLPILARLDADAGRRAAEWALPHPEPGVRVAGVQAVAAARLDGFLPALQTMAVNEDLTVRIAVIRELQAFDRSVWLPVYREVFRRSPIDALADVMSERGIAELAPEARRMLARAETWAATRWAHALDAAVNSVHRRRWADLELPDTELTLDSLVAFLHERGVPARLTDAALQFDDRELHWGPRKLGERLRNLHWEGRHYGGSEYYAAVSGPEGVTIMTMEEAKVLWKERSAAPPPAR